MKDLSAIKKIYFIGIGGIGMSGLARYCKSRGIIVGGYDKTNTHLTQELENEGIEIHYDENLDCIYKDADVVVFTPAIPTDHKELVYYKNNNYPVLKRSDLLQIITKEAFTIAVAGTHGKTTTTTLIAHILTHSQFDCTAFLGGISGNYDTNFLLGKNNVVVVEADEYDRSFLKLNPDIAVITSCDADHLDIYVTADNVKEAYTSFANNIKSTGSLFIKEGLKLSLDNIIHSSYSSDSSTSDIHGASLQLNKGLYAFDWMSTDAMIDNILLPMPGRHNVENAVAAIAVAHKLGIDPYKIKAAVESFKGVKRRFEIIVNNDSVTYIDDYAHHPQEIRSFLSAVKVFRSNRKILCVFQPHLFSRTKDFVDGFAEALSIADEIILLPIYPARELPIEGVASEMIIKKMTNTKASVMTKEQTLEHIKKHNHEVICTIGAGDIDTMVEPIGNYLKTLN